MEAQSIADKASASGTDPSEELFPKLALCGHVLAKSKKTFSERIGTIIARGQAEPSFQQVSELIPITGLDFGALCPNGPTRYYSFCRSCG
jgi:molybdate transport system substrate-binding protein